jgi:hypothetical protein
VVFDDLQVGSRAGLLGAEEHRSDSSPTLRLLRIIYDISSISCHRRGTTFLALPKTNH